MALLSADQHRMIRFAARSVYQRVAAFQGDAAPDADRPIAAEAAAALQSWGQVFSPGDREAFARRLRWDGLEWTTVARALSVAGSAEESSDLSADPPERDWTVWLDLVLEEASGYLPDELLQPGQVKFQIAGLRALPIEEGDTAEARRSHLIETSRDGLISVAGGKLTTHRLIAMDALRRVRDPRLESLEPDCGQLPGTGWSLEVEAHTGLPQDVADNLARLYGDEAGRVLRLAAGMPDGLERIHPAGPDVWAQTAYAVESEWAYSADDIARRRTSLSVRGLVTSAIVERLSAIVRANAQVREFATLKKSASERP